MSDGKDRIAQQGESPEESSEPVVGFKDNAQVFGVVVEIGKTASELTMHAFKLRSVDVELGNECREIAATVQEFYDKVSAWTVKCRSMAERKEP